MTEQIVKDVEQAIKEIKEVIQDMDGELKR